MSKWWNSQHSVTLKLNAGSSKSEDVQSIVTTNLFKDAGGFLTNLRDYNVHLSSKGAQQVEDKMRETAPWMGNFLCEESCNFQLKMILQDWDKDVDRNVVENVSISKKVRPIHHSIVYIVIFLDSDTIQSFHSIQKQCMIHYFLLHDWYACLLAQDASKAISLSFCPPHVAPRWMIDARRRLLNWSKIHRDP